jgi:hypothetical protein
VSTAWILVLAVGAGTIALKGAGTMVLGSRTLPSPAQAVIALLAPSLLAGLIVVQTLDDDGALAIDARLAGVAACAVALAMRAPLLVALTAAAAVAAGARALGAA